MADVLVTDGMQIVLSRHSHLLTHSDRTNNRHTEPERSFQLVMRDTWLLFWAESGWCRRTLKVQTYLEKFLNASHLQYDPNRRGCFYQYVEEKNQTSTCSVF